MASIYISVSVPAPTVQQCEQYLKSRGWHLAPDSPTKIKGRSVHYWITNGVKFPYNHHTFHTDPKHEAFQGEEIESLISKLSYAERRDQYDIWEEIKTTIIEEI